MAKALATKAAGNVLPLLDRPQPPADMIHGEGWAFRASPEVSDWIHRAFIDEAGPLHFPGHAHLAEAHIGVLWTIIENTRQGRRIVGTAEMPSRSNQGGKWARARVTQQIEAWFGVEPDFLITLDAVYAAEASDADFCALVDHELCHCAQEIDVYGAPKFHKDSDLPAYALRSHDVEEFTSVVRRFGPGQEVQALIDAAARPPEIAPARISQACGTCQRRTA